VTNGLKILAKSLTSHIILYSESELLRMASDCMSYNLEFQNFLEEERSTPHLRLRCSVRASGTQLSPYFINKISIGISLLQEELKNVVIYNY
jgi:hypothetical protein